MKKAAFLLAIAIVFFSSAESSRSEEIETGLRCGRNSCAEQFMNGDGTRISMILNKKGCPHIFYIPKKTLGLYSQIRKNILSNDFMVSEFSIRIPRIFILLNPWDSPKSPPKGIIGMFLTIPVPGGTMESIKNFDENDSEIVKIISRQIGDWLLMIKDTSPKN